MPRTPQPTVEIIDGPDYEERDRHNARTWEHHRYRLRLRFQGRQMTAEWRQGLGITDDPDAFDLLAALLSDAVSAENASGVWDFASEYGYEIDDEESYERVKATLSACEKVGDDLRRVFGEVYAQAVERGEFEPSDLRRAWPEIVAAAR